MKKRISQLLGVTISALCLGLPPLQAQPAHPPADVTGQAVGLLRASNVICYNITRGQEVRGATDVDGHFDCQALGLTAQPGDTVQVSIAGTADHLPINFFAQGIVSPPAFVSCMLRVTEDEIINRGSATTAFDCRRLPMNQGEPVTLRIRGAYEPKPVLCPCFNADRIANLIDVLASLPNSGFRGARCAFEQGFVQWLDEDRTDFTPHLLFVASSGSTNRCNIILVNHNSQGLVHEVQAPITPAEFQACYNLILPHCPAQ